LQLHHVAIQVSDLERAGAFYSGLLGLPEVRRQPHSIWLDAGGVILMLEVVQSGATAGRPELTPWKSDRPGLHLVAAYTI
jgi:glyoxylase I family protein